MPREWKTAPDPVASPRRIAVVGVSGSGKSTLATRLASRLELVHLELDSLQHQANWTPLPPARFRERVDRFTSTHDAWVVDGNYGVVRDLVWGRADTVVWLDLPRWKVMGQLLHRTTRRWLHREELWNGNRESIDNFIYLWDPDRSLLAWAWTQHAVYRRTYASALTDPRWSGIRFVRLQDRAAADRWMAGLGRPEIN